jgi:transcriptional regulator
MVLKALTRGPSHGYAVAEFIHLSSNDVLRVEEGALYPALHRLELRGLLSSEWGLSDNNRRAKFYTLTAAGHRHLTSETDSWARLAAAVTQVLNAT